MSLSGFSQYTASRREQGLLRELRTEYGYGDRSGLHFCSNDYLGLSQHPDVIAAFQRGLSEYGCGSGGSPLICGHTSVHEELSERLADWMQRDRVLLFNSGYAANSGVLQALSSTSSTLLFDKLNHASLYDGAQSSASTLLRFRHNDMNMLAKQLTQLTPEQDALVVSEGVFSMDGDQIALPECLHTLKEHRRQSDRESWLWIDDAHGVGVTGARRAGIAGMASQQDIAIVSGTFGKAFGLSGAYVACSSELEDYFIQCSRHYIYSTAFSAAQACAILQALSIIQQDDELQQKLEFNIKLFRELASQRELSLLPSHTAIQPLLIGSSQKAVAYSEALKKQGVYCSAIRPPTVPPKQSRLRFTLSAAHSESDIEYLFTQLDRIHEQHPEFLQNDA
ncbi:8-amino-7-oxononanoate synthase [Aliidiomarina minuta]|uniref:8-amino-7-oxononanoate synthase n=1 Tax=Aliidiomarina minuta TaxID=880057 RepID=A0A432W6L4_9GAMM|nr:8-amino-7-oxononanoate synthase [Aliidiomarina minuta]RUO25661.1 8-amino-7-oxononanoate synthase [Aliidiomarina minuta]